MSSTPILEEEIQRIKNLVEKEKRKWRELLKTSDNPFDAVKRILHEARALTEELDRANKRYAELDSEHQRLMQNYRKLVAAIEQLTNPPFDWGVIQRIYTSRARDPDTKQEREVVSCEVRLANGAPKLVGVGPGIRKDRLERGLAVWLNENSVIVELVIDPQLFYGERAVLVSRFSDDQVLVRQGENISTAWLADSLREAELKPDCALLVDRGTRTVFAVLPVEEQAREFILEEIPDITFADIGGLEKAIEEIHEQLIYPVKYAELYDFNEVPFPQGGVLWGPPGNGKTMLAKAIANTLGRKFYIVQGPELERKWVGETEGLIRYIFNEANRQPSIVFFDDADSFLRRRGSDIHSYKDDHVAQFISLIGGLKSFKNVIVLVASNRVDIIDPAVLRPERLGDMKILVPSPDRAAAASVLSKHLKPGVAIEGMARSDERAAQWIKEMIAEIVEHLYAHNERTKFAKVYFDNGDTKKLFFDAVVSGAILAGIVRRARRKIVQRAKAYVDCVAAEIAASGAALEKAHQQSLTEAIAAEERGEIGLRTEDLIEACGEEFSAAASLPLTHDAIKSWAKMKGIMNEIIDVLPYQEALERGASSSGTDL